MTNKVNLLARPGIHQASPVRAEVSFNDFDDSGPGFSSAFSAMRRIRTLAAQMAKVDLPVLLVGDSGAGKGAVARLIHKLSPRAQHVFAVLDCSRLSDDALEIELFGFEAPTAFNGGRPKRGVLELCNRGTVLLDNFTEMPPRMQARLLDLLDDGQLSRVGGQGRIRVDVRILASTPLDLGEALAIGKLRTDLYYRLNTLTLHLPPSRQLTEERPVVLTHPRPRSRWDFEDFVRRFELLGEGSSPRRGVQGKGGKAGGALAVATRYAS